jgi:hypothetical protein
VIVLRRRNKQPVGVRYCLAKTGNRARNRRALNVLAEERNLGQVVNPDPHCDRRELLRGPKKGLVVGALTQTASYPDDLERQRRA